LWFAITALVNVEKNNTLEKKKIGEDLCLERYRKDGKINQANINLIQNSSFIFFITSIRI
jgi:hypothetical protein